MDKALLAINKDSPGDTLNGCIKIEYRNPNGARQLKSRMNAKGGDHEVIAIITENAEQKLADFENMFAEESVGGGWYRSTPEIREYLNPEQPTELTNEPQSKFPNIDIQFEQMAIHPEKKCWVDFAQPIWEFVTDDTTISDDEKIGIYEKMCYRQKIARTADAYKNATSVLDGIENLQIADATSRWKQNLEELGITGENADPMTHQQLPDLATAENLPSV